jgi:hypothetical protein
VSSEKNDKQLPDPGRVGVTPMNGQLASAQTLSRDPAVTRRTGECIPFPGPQPESGLASQPEPAPVSRSEFVSRRGPGLAAQPEPAAVRCVWTAHLDEGSCARQVPRAVMQEAWRRELERAQGHAGFFQFRWQDEVWLGYGLADGQVRGAFCPAHRAEREQRLGYDPGLAV